MKSIEVVAAIILGTNEAGAPALFATQRGYGDFAGGWEFPGGKVEPGETPECALIREIREELDCTVVPDSFFMTIDYDYPSFHLTMHCYLAHVVEGAITLLEHTDARWLGASELNSVEWLPADTAIIETILNSGVLA